MLGPVTSSSTGPSPNSDHNVNADEAAGAIARALHVSDVTVRSYLKDEDKPRGEPGGEEGMDVGSPAAQEEGDQEV